MAFLIEFKGVFLVLEMLTIFTYSLDIAFISRRYIRLNKQLSLIETPDGAEMRFLSDYDDLRNKVRHLQLDIIASIIGIIPFSLLLQHQKTANFVINFLRVLRLVKIWPFFRVIQPLKRINVNFIRWLEVLISYYIVAHIVASVWLSVGLTADDVRETWLNRVPSPIEGGVRLVNNLDDVSYASLYIHALYFSVNTISHCTIGDVSPVTTSERALGSFMIWLLCFFYAFCFANIEQIVGYFLGENFLMFLHKFSSVKAKINNQKLP